MVSVFEPLKFYCILEAIIIIIMMKATSLESISVGFQIRSDANWHVLHKQMAMYIDNNEFISH